MHINNAIKMLIKKNVKTEPVPLKFDSKKM